MEGISDSLSEETVKDYKDIYRKKTKIKWVIGNKKRFASIFSKLLTLAILKEVVKSDINSKL